MKTQFCLATLLFAGIVQANVAVPPGAGFWQSTSGLSVSGEKLTGTLNNGGGAAAYWNSDTADSKTQCANIGCFVTKQSYFGVGGTGELLGANSPNWSAPAYLGNDDGTAVNDFYFQGTQGGTSIKAEVAGLSGSNWIGWYDRSKNVADLTASDIGVIFRGSDATGATTTFSPTSSYGLWFLSGYSSANTPAAIATANNGVLNALQTSTSAKFTQSGKNGSSAGTTNQYFSVFAQNSSAAQVVPVTYFVGVEDVNFANGADKDYNDLVLSLTVVPEPGFYGILSLGVVGLGLARRRRS